LELRKKLDRLFIFILLLGAAGLGMFISLWNSSLNDNNLIFISVVLLFIFLSLTGFLFISIRGISASLLKTSKQDEILPGTDSQLQSGSERKLIVSNTDPEELLRGITLKQPLKKAGEKLLSNLAKEFSIVQGVFFVLNPESGLFSLVAQFACSFEKLPADFAEGEGLNGQAAADKKLMCISGLPEAFTPAVSGLGKGRAPFLYIIPILKENITRAVIEISTFTNIDEEGQLLLEELMNVGGNRLFPVSET
jgi:hypothetical protein